MCEWRPRVSIRHLPWSLSTLVFEMRSLTEARTPGFVWAGWPASSQGSSAPAAPGLALRAYQHAWLLSRLWRAELRSSCLHGEHLPDWCSAPQSQLSLVTLKFEILCNQLELKFKKKRKRKRETKILVKPIALVYPSSPMGSLGSSLLPSKERVCSLLGTFSHYFLSGLHMCSSAHGRAATFLLSPNSPRLLCS